MRILNPLLDCLLNLLACACALCAIPPAAAAAFLFLLGRITHGLTKSADARQNA